MTEPLAISAPATPAERAAWVCMGVGLLVAASITAAAVLLLVGFIRGHLGDLPALFRRMAEILDETRLLIPVVGNLLSNTVIVVIALGVSSWIALLSLAFLVVIHKLEYVLNARIVGGEINAAAWEILVALFAAEAVFGVPGVIAAPIIYAYGKKELQDRGLV